MIHHLFTIVLLSGCSAALWKGYLDEHMTAAVLLMAAVLALLVDVRSFAVPEIGLLVVASALVAFLIGLVMTSDRFRWMWAAGLQIVGRCGSRALRRRLELAEAVYGRRSLLGFSCPRGMGAGHVTRSAFPRGVTL